MGQRKLLGLLLLAGLGGSVALSWYAWRRYTAPVPPKVASEELDPELAQAIEQARQKIQADPYTASHWGDLGKLLRASQLLPEAAACFAEAEKLDPQKPSWPYLQGEALRMVDLDAAVTPLRRAAERMDPADTIAPSLRLAEVLLAQGHNEEAETRLRQALTSEPDNPTVHYNLGILALERGDLSVSLTHLQRGEHSPFTQRKVCSQLAAIYKRIGKPEQAERYSRKADTLPVDSNWIDPFLTDVVVVGRPARFQQIHQMQIRGDYRNAAEQLSALIQEQPEYRAYVALAEVLEKLGDFDRAEQALRAGIALEPEKFRAYHQLSRILWLRASKMEHTDRHPARADFEEAAACARKAIARQADDAMAHLVLGLSLRQLGTQDEALQAFRTAVELGPNLTDAHLYLGQTLADAGQVDAARRSLRRAVELSPDDPRPQKALAKLKKN